MVDHWDEDVEINCIRARLASLEAERDELEGSLAEIERRRAAAPTIRHCPVQAANNPNVTTTSPIADKVALFRRLFAGRSDVFPLRWENQKTGKSGYAPACANEWVQGCMRQAAGQMRGVPPSSLHPGLGRIIDKHLRGGDGPRSAGAFVAGVYPMLPDETCWFLAADFDKESWAADAVGDDRNLPGEGRARRARTVPVRQWRPCLDFLFGAGPSAHRSPAWAPRS